MDRLKEEIQAFMNHISGIFKAVLQWIRQFFVETPDLPEKPLARNLLSS